MSGIVVVENVAPKINVNQFSVPNLLPRFCACLTSPYFFFSPRVKHTQLYKVITTHQQVKRYVESDFYTKWHPSTN